ncbi:hypothetical protein F8388_022897 [Cannabis sativa]|uniref:Uncharacterized protein n=1 Tax=Cannabis sativa TaxID=3483 RepID=A0A7J6FEX7_CANSA|nr:hypothetical protein F8388_022897 [Cannabis sativa]
MEKVSNNGDRFELIFDYIKMLDLEESISKMKVLLKFDWCVREKPRGKKKLKPPRTRAIVNKRDFFGMDTNNWRPIQGEEPTMDTTDWRTQLQHDSRQRIVNKSLNMYIKKHMLTMETKSQNDNRPKPTDPSKRFANLRVVGSLDGHLLVSYGTDCGKKISISKILSLRLKVGK